MHRQTADRCKLPQAFWRAAEDLGLPAPALLRQARLPATLHITPAAWLTTAQYFALWQAVETLSRDPAVGLHMSTATAMALHPPATMSAFFARDYRDGLHRLARFKRLCTPEELWLTEADSECRIALRWLFASGHEPDSTADMTFAAILELGRRGTGRPLRPLRIEMTRSGPVSATHHAYFDAPIRTGCPQNVIVLRAEDFDLPFAGHNPDLLAILDPSPTEIVAHSSLSEQVKILIKRCIASGKPELGDIAREMGTSERTLQRRITEQGSSFRGLLERARQEMARHLLENGQHGIDEIAFLLGFQDISAFYRAFRSWEGVTPAQWRGLC